MADLVALSGNRLPVSTHVIFLHGLGGDKENTWLSSSTSHDLWPVWLLQDLHEIEVWSVGYDAAPTNWQGFSMPLQDRGENVLARLLAEDRLSTGQIILIGHSLGGLVIKQLLRSAERDAYSSRQAESFLHRVRRVAFLGTPHFGARLPVIARILDPIIRRSSSTIILERNNASLRDLNHWYRKYASRNSIKHLVLQETRPISINGYALPGFLGFIVLPDSSDPGVEAAPIPIDADHSSLVKPENRQSETYIHIVNFIKEPFDQPHKDIVVVETFQAETADIKSLIKSESEKQSQVLEEIRGAVFDNKTVQLPDEIWKTKDATIIDREAYTRLEKIRQSRNFAGFDLPVAASQLAANLESGDLTGTTASAKREIFGWCSRFLITTSKERAKQIIEIAERYGEAESIEIAKSFIDADSGNLGAALKRLKEINTPTARSAGLFIVCNNQGEKKGIEWLRQAEIDASDLDPDGKLRLLCSMLQQELWAQALDIAKGLTAADIECAPAILAISGATHLIQAVPDELKSSILEQTPFQIVDFPLASDTISLQHRRIAQISYAQAFREAERLGMKQAAKHARERSLWLALKDPEHFTEARKELQKCMEDPKISLQNLPLALQFGLQVDIPTIEREIDRQMALTGGNSVDAAVARLAVAFSQQGAAKVAAYINRYRDELNNNLDVKAIGFLESEALAKSGQVGKLEETIAQLRRNSLSSAEEERLQRLMEDAVGNDPVGPRLALYESSGSITDLRVLVNCLEDQQDWARLAQYSQRLFDLTKDIADARRFVIALYNTEKYEYAYQVSQEYPEFTSQSEDIKTVRCWALYQLGYFVEARAEVRQLRLAKDNSRHKVLATHIAISSGDWEAVQEFIEQEWIERGTRTVEDLLHAAKLAQLISSPRTQELTIEAATKGAASPEVLVACYMIACQAGWETSEEVSKWMLTAADLSAQRDDDDKVIKTVSLRDLVEQHPQWEQRSSDVRKMLTEGATPTFLAAKALNQSYLGMLLLGALANTDEPDARKRSIIYGISGKRGRIDLLPKKIAIDISALLTAELLEITEKIISHFDETIISHDTLGWLFEESRKVLFHQPSRIKHAHQFRQLINEKKFCQVTSTTSVPQDLEHEVGEDLALLLSEAKASTTQNGVQHIVVRPAPVHKLGSLAEEEADLTKYHDCLCSCAPIINKLWELGQLTTQELHDGLLYLKNREQQWPTTVHVEDNATLYLDDVAIAYFEHLEVLTKLHKAGFRILVGQHKIKESDDFIELERQSGKAFQIVDQLRKKLRNGIESGKVKVGRHSSAMETSEAEGRSFGRHPTLSLIKNPGLADALVIDDRFMNQHKTISTDGRELAVLTTADILLMLEACGALNENQIDCSQTNLRRIGMILIPLEQKTLERHLHAATVSKERLNENAEMKAIRENIEKIRMTDALKIPEEIEWLQDVRLSCLRSMRQQWIGDVSPSTASAKSDWLLALFDIRKWAHRFNECRSFYDDLYKQQLLELAMLLFGVPNGASAMYWTWLEHRILAPLLKDKPETHDWLVSQVSLLVSNIVTNQGD